MQDALLEELLGRISHNTVNKESIQKAINFALHNHKGQKRLTGEDFICHPLKVAISALENNLKPDTDVIAACLLHDVVEDTKVRLTDIWQVFGKNIGQLVEGLSRKKRISASTINAVIDLMIKNNASHLPFIKNYLNKIKFIEKNQEYVSFFDFIDKLIEALRSLQEEKIAREMICGVKQEFKYPLFTNIKDILIFTEMFNDATHASEEMSVISSLEHVFKCYDEQVIKKICLIKTLDRLDNLGSIYIFDREKQEKIKQNTIRDILPLALEVSIFMFQQMCRICSSNVIQTKIVSQSAKQNSIEWNKIYT